MLSEALQRLADLIEADVPLRPEQLPPPEDGDWLTQILLAGRGFGKTLAGARWIRGLAESGKYRRLALIGPTAADVRDTMVLGESGIVSISPRSSRPLYEPSKRRLVWENGVEATLFSSEEPDRLRGPQFHAASLDELCSWKNLEETYNMLQFGLRLGKKPLQVITTTPKPSKLLRELLKRDGLDVVVRRGKTFDNARNLPKAFLDQMQARYAGTRLGRQELEAALLDDVQGALWRREQFEATRLPLNFPVACTRIVVSIDPAVTVGEDSDETGIIVAGVDERNHAYVIQDLSVKFSPTEWATIAVKAFHMHAANRIIVETNIGGDLVENTLRVVDRNVPIRRVTAKRGKLIRGEPVSALYEQNGVHHVGMFAELEDQMCTFSPGSTDSPDRLDALVYALTDLMVTAQRRNSSSAGLKR